MGPIEEAMRKALVIYKERGGAVGTGEDYMGRVCVMGAVGYAESGAVYGWSEETQFLLEEAALVMTGRANRPWKFNDRHPGRGSRNLLRRAIRIAQERGL